MKIFLLSSFVVLLAACDRESATIVTEDPVINDSVVVVPSRFARSDFIELNKIERISKFRSGIGHDYRDDAESCRSMKHYYQPKSGTDWSTVKIFSPVAGTIVRTFDEWAGTQVQIQPLSARSYTVILFHVALGAPLSAGDTVTAGQQIGTHIGSQTMSDIAVFHSLGGKRYALSYFEIMDDSIFLTYASRGVTARSDLIISKTERDNDPLHCSGDTFGTPGTVANWYVLK